MIEYVLESKEDALKIVFGNKFNDFMFNDVSDVLSQRRISEMGNLLHQKENRLSLLNAEKLNILYNTLANPQSASERGALEEVLKAVDRKIQAFVTGKEDIEGDCIESMISLIQKCSKNAVNKNNHEMYNMALNRAVLVGQKYDAENGLSDITKDKISLIESNLKKMSEWQVDVTNLDETPENRVVNIPEDRFLEFVQKRIIGKENVSFSDLHSAFIALKGYKKSEETYTPIEKQAEARILKSLKSKENLSPSELISAKYVYDELQTSNKKIVKSIHGFGKKIALSVQKNKSIKVFDAIESIIRNTEVTGKAKFFGREIVKQTDKNGKLKKNSDIALWLEAVRNKTLCQLATTSGLTKDKFNQVFIDNAVCEYMELAVTNNTFDKKSRKKDFKKLFANIGNNKKIRISQDVIMGGVANLASQNESFVSRLSIKLKKVVYGIEDSKERAAKTITSNKIVATLKDKGEALDEKCTKSWGDKYLMAKGFVKAIGKQSAWAMAFNVAKVVGVATNATWVLPTVVAVSFANATYQFGKDYIQAKNDVKKKGKELKFKDFCKKNKVRLGSLALSGAVTAATAGVLGANASSVILNSKVLVSGGLVACKIADKIAEDKKKNKNKIQIFVGACMTAVTSTVGYLVSKGMGKEAFDSSKNFVDVSASYGADNEVDSSFGIHGKGKDRLNNKRQKAIKIVPLSSVLNKETDGEKYNVVQSALDKYKTTR